ncbi:MAG: hypothetical protein HY362_03895 [Candidatus Aenigmarchaeota archaeon]|nr:hypothetical protein [Candidatus Aenigmarchaeota archaeon]
MDMPELTVRKIGEKDSNGNHVIYDSQDNRRISLGVSPPYGLVLSPSDTNIYIHVSSDVPVQLAASLGVDRFLMPMLVPDKTADPDPLAVVEKWKKPCRRSPVRIYLLREYEKSISDRDVESREPSMTIYMNVMPNPLKPAQKRVPYAQAYNSANKDREHHLTVGRMLESDDNSEIWTILKPVRGVFGGYHWKTSLYSSMTGKNQALEFRTGKIKEMETEMKLDPPGNSPEEHLRRILPLLDYGIWNGYCENELTPTEAWLFTLGNNGKAFQRAVAYEENKLAYPTGNKKPLSESSLFLATARERDPVVVTQRPMHERIAEAVHRDMETAERSRRRPRR